MDDVLKPSLSTQYMDNVMTAWEYHRALAGQGPQQEDVSVMATPPLTPMKNPSPEILDDDRMLSECSTLRPLDLESGWSSPSPRSPLESPPVSPNFVTGVSHGTTTPLECKTYSKTISKRNPKSHIMCTSLKLAPRGRGIYKESYFLNAPEVLEALDVWPAAVPTGNPSAVPRIRQSGMWRRRPQQTGELDLASYLLARDQAVEETAKVLFIY